MKTHIFELTLKNPSAMDCAIAEGEIVVASDRYRQIWRRSSFFGLAVLAISGQSKRVYCLVKRSPIPLLGNTCLLGTDTQRHLSVECGDKIEITKIDNPLKGIFLYGKTHPIFWIRLATRLLWLALIGTTVIGLCALMTPLLGVEVWSQTLSKTEVSIPWLVLPIWMKFKKSGRKENA
jgi:hypothetical protein